MYVTTRAAPSSSAILRAAMLPKRRVAGALSGALTITIAHEGLGSIDDPGADYATAITAAAAALNRLSTKAAALELAASSETAAEIARHAKRFADVTGPRSLNRAVETGDAQELIDLQRGIRGVTETVTSELVDSVVERFLMMHLGFLLAGPYGVVVGATVPESAIDQAKNLVAEVKTPPAPQEIPWWVWSGGGAATFGAMTFVRNGNPREMLAAGVGGAVIGALLRYGLESLGDKFTLPFGKR